MTQGHSNVCQKQPAIQCKSCHVNPSVYKKTERKKKERKRENERERKTGKQITENVTNNFNDSILNLPKQNLKIKTAKIQPLAQ